MLLAPHVHWIQGVQANVYLCVEADSCTLIDTGKESIDRVDVILNYLERLHFYPAGLKRIVLTHAHAEQAGNVAALQEICEATVYASAAAGRSLVAGLASDVGASAGSEEVETGVAEPTGRLARLRERSQGFPALTAVDAFETIAAGDVLPVLDGLLVLNAAGHTPDQLAFYLPRTGVLFAGDALCRGRSGWDVPTAVDKTLAHQTAQRLLSLSPAVVAAAQGQPHQPHTLFDILSIQPPTMLGEQA
ncbi:MAG: MBL fold metallo-hydrolase [Anaerolineales bacterium]|nr:MBL fold metallo-hydrolase [Anaerolineales bacterium]